MKILPNHSEMSGRTGIVQALSTDVLLNISQDMKIQMHFKCLWNCYEHDGHLVFDAVFSSITDTC